MAFKTPFLTGELIFSRDLWIAICGREMSELVRAGDFYLASERSECEVTE